MMMEKISNATDVRKDWGHFIDTVAHVRPQFVKRNRDTIVAVSTEHLKTLLGSYRFKLDLTKEANGSYSGSVDLFDLATNAPTIDQLKLALAHELVDYAQEYVEEFALYFNAPNRRDHAPYVMHVLLQNDIPAVMNLIDD